MTASAHSKRRVSTHQGPLDWVLVLSWLTADGVLTEQDAQLVRQRFAAGTSSQHPWCVWLALGSKRAGTGLPWSWSR